MSGLTRRSLLCGCSSAIAGLAGSRFNGMVFGQPGIYNEETLVVLFLRGGMDGLSFIPPTGSTAREPYEIARPNIQIPLSGSNAALKLNNKFAPGKANPDWLRYT